jgi:hypothetical protein
MKCALCKDSGWVCENHPHRPWDGRFACGFGGVGAPCPECSGTNDGNTPRMRSGFTPQFDKKRWRH